MKNIILVSAMIFMATSIHAESTAEEYKAILNKYGKEKLIVMVAEAFNKDCPLTIDRYTKIVSVMPYSNRLSYQVSFVGIPYDKLKPIITPLKEKQKITGTNRMCTSEDSRVLLDAGLIIEYEFYTEDGRYLFSYDVDKSDCANIK
ncbi:MAG: hypothetical protein FP811_14390 [Desulfobacteraceae bacterium]|jgi:hypothetical protein|nr:hypothetical protein [Desulfobacteraceae bacterium]